MRAIAVYILKGLAGIVLLPVMMFVIVVGSPLAILWCLGIGTWNSLFGDERI